MIANKISRSALEWPQGGLLDPVRGAVWAALLIGFVVIALPVQALAQTLRSPLARWLPMTFHRLSLKALGARVKTIGVPASQRPLLMVANHISWSDISALGAQVPAAFVAKSDVAGWPFIGTLARLAQTVFVERTRRSDTARTSSDMAARMVEGNTVVLFAEGTSSDGNRVLPFKPALIGAATRLAAETGGPVAVQPVSIAYVRFSGMMAGHQHRHLLNWMGDLSLLPHLWQMLKTGAVDIEITFGEAMIVEAASDRKAVAAQCEAVIRAAHGRSAWGRE